jgi:hypothetical protein
MNYTTTISSGFFNHIFASYFHPTKEKILSFGKLTDGWNYGEGAPIAGNILEEGIKLIDVLNENDFRVTDAFPGLSGELRITAYYDSYYIEFTFEDVDNILFSLELDGEQLKEEKLNFSHAEGKIRELRAHLCATSNSSTELTMMFNLENFKTWFLKTQRMDQEYPLLMNPVQ